MVFPLFYPSEPSSQNGNVTRNSHRNPDIKIDGLMPCSCQKLAVPWTNVALLLARISLAQEEHEEQPLHRLNLESQLTCVEPLRKRVHLTTTKQNLAGIMDVSVHLPWKEKKMKKETY